MRIKSTFIPGSTAPKATEQAMVAPPPIKSEDLHPPLSDSRRKSVEAAALAYSELEQEMGSLRIALNAANVEIAGLRVEVENLKLIRDAANEHAAECQRDKEQALLERGQLENLLDHIRCVIERAQLPPTALFGTRRLTITVEDVIADGSADEPLEAPGEGAYAGLG